MIREQTIMALLILINFLFSKKYSLPMNLFVAICCTTGILYNIQKEESDQYLTEHWFLFLKNIFRLIME